MSLKEQLEMAKPVIADAMKKDGLKSYIIICENGVVDFVGSERNIVSEHKEFKEKIDHLEKVNKEMLSDIKSMIQKLKEHGK